MTKQATLLVILLLPLSLSAAERPCPNTLPPAELQACASAQAAGAQQRLDRLLQELERSLNEENWEYLEESEELWEKVREFDCGTQASFQDKPYRTSIRHLCEAWYSRERMHQLRYMLCPRYWRNGQCEAEKEYE